MDELKPERRRHVRMLTDTQSARVAALAVALLLDENGAFKRNTFLIDADGNIREPNAVQRFTRAGDHGWHALAELTKQPDVAHSSVELVKLFCTQSVHDSTALFREKGLFMKQVVALAEKEHDASGKAIHNTRGLHSIPVHRNKAASVSEEMGAVRRAIFVPGSAAPAPRRLDYKAKVAAITPESPQELTPGEFLRYVLEGQGEKRFQSRDIIYLFERALGYSEGYLSSNVLNARRVLPLKIQEHLTTITKSGAYFWAKDKYSSADAKEVSDKLDAYVETMLRQAADERAEFKVVREQLRERGAVDSSAPNR